LKEREGEAREVSTNSREPEGNYNGRKGEPKKPVGEDDLSDRATPAIFQREGRKKGERRLYEDRSGPLQKQKAVCLRKGASEKKLLPQETNLHHLSRIKEGNTTKKSQGKALSGVPAKVSVGGKTPSSKG